MTNENFDINPDTGLPELPEGYAWYVKDDNGAAVVLICAVVEHWFGSDDDPYEYNWLHYVKTEETRQETKKEISSNPLLGAFGVKTSKRFTKVKYLRYKTIESEAASEWSDSAILLASIKLMDSWSAQRSYQSTKDRLSGPYPPNKLKNEEE